MKKIFFTALFFFSLICLCSCGAKELSVEKSSNRDQDRTVHPGDMISYVFSVENPTAFKKEVEITDVLPANTTLVGGDFTEKDGRLSLSASVKGKSTEYFSYTVRVFEDESLIGTPIVSSGATALGASVPSDTLYIGRTLNEADREKFAYAVHAMQDSKMKSAELVRFLYSIAFSNYPAIINQSPETVVTELFLDREHEKTEAVTSAVVPGLYGGKKMNATLEACFPGVSAEGLSIADLLPGDLLYTLPTKRKPETARVYCTDGMYLYDLTDACERLGLGISAAALADCDYYAVLRPVRAMNTFCRSETLPHGETDIEKSIIATAEAFLLRGDRMQYADTRLVSSEKNYRWERGKAPEDYTTDETGYSNCTGFVHDVYLHALGYDYGNFQLREAPSAMKAYTYYLTGNETDAEKRAVERKYLASLQIGDIVFYSISSNNHAMLYIGNGNLIHCTGNTHNGYVEIEEPAIRFDRVESLFDPARSRYVFQTEKPRTALYIIRPLNTWEGSAIPEAAEKRIGDMRGVFAEKTCSATLGQTANPGDTLTYTFSVFNTNETEVKLSVSDRIPANTALLLDGAPSGQSELSWELTLAPLEKKTLSYTVKISETAVAGTAVLCTDESRVGGIAVKATPVFIGNTLTAEEQEKIVAATEKRIGSSLGAIDLINEIYREALGVENVIGVTREELADVIFPESGSLRKLAESGYYADMIAPSQYGGRTVKNSDRFLGERTRLTRERNLIVGDILYLQGSSSYGLYLYLGEGRLLNLAAGLAPKDLEERLEVTLGWPMFAVLRPSLAIK